LPRDTALPRLCALNSEDGTPRSVANGARYRGVGMPAPMRPECCVLGGRGRGVARGPRRTRRRRGPRSVAAEAHSSVPHCRRGVPLSRRAREWRLPPGHPRRRSGQGQHKRGQRAGCGGLFCSPALIQDPAGVALPPPGCLSSVSPRCAPGPRVAVCVSVKKKSPGGPTPDHATCRPTPDRRQRVVVRFIHSSGKEPGCITDTDGPGWNQPIWAPFSFQVTQASPLCGAGILRHERRVGRAHH